MLPFVDLSPERDQEYFSDGLTEELITSLSQVPGLRVAARTSSFQFKGRDADVHEIGRKLDVGAVLEGSVRKSGDRLRVSAQLINVADGYQLWSESYDRQLADVFAVQRGEASATLISWALTLSRSRLFRTLPSSTAPKDSVRPISCTSACRPLNWKYWVRAATRSPGTRSAAT